MRRRTFFKGLLMGLIRREEKVDREPRVEIVLLNGKEEMARKETNDSGLVSFRVQKQWLPITHWVMAVEGKHVIRSKRLFSTLRAEDTMTFDTRMGDSAILGEDL